MPIALLYPCTLATIHAWQFTCLTSTNISHAQALEGFFPSISVSLSARLFPEGMSPEEADAATGPPPEGHEETLPWRYFSDDKEAEECNVMDVGISGWF